MIKCEDINKHMNAGGCPTAGSLGECAAIDIIGTSPRGVRYEAYLYLHDDEFNDSALVASWFHKLGASRVWVQHVLYSDCNDDRDGKDPYGVRPWLVSYELPPTD